MKNYNNVTWREETLEVNPNSSMEKYFMDSIKPNVFVFSGCNTTLYISTQKTPSPKDYEFQINQNDSQVFGKPIPINTMYIVNPSTATATLKLYYACMDFDPLFLKSFKPQNIDVSAKFEGSLPAGSNKIGTVGISGALPSGTNKIGNVGITGALPAGANTLGKVGITGALPAGTNVIGKVEVVGGLGDITVSAEDFNSFLRRTKVVEWDAGKDFTINGGQRGSETLVTMDGTSIHGAWYLEKIAPKSLPADGYVETIIFEQNSTAGREDSRMDVTNYCMGLVNNHIVSYMSKMEFHPLKQSTTKCRLICTEVFIPDKE